LIKIPPFLATHLVFVKKEEKKALLKIGSAFLIYRTF